MGIRAGTDLLPTADDVAFYHEHGYWISRPIVPDEVLDAAERGMARLYAGDLDHALPDGRREHGWTGADGDVLRKNDYSSLLVDELARLVRSPLIAACAARLSGASEVRLWHDQLLYKPGRPDGAPAAEPGDGMSAQPATARRSVNVGWHTDRQYWMTCSSAAMLTAWVPFHDVDVEFGAVTFVDGSHRWPEDVVLNFFDPDLSTLDRLAADHDLRPVPAVVPRGAMSFHHCRTIHGSGPNRHAEPRRALAIHLQPGDNHFVRRLRPDGSLAHHGNDRLVRAGTDGLPDYADPAVCPRLWPRPDR